MCVLAAHALVALVSWMDGKLRRREHGFHDVFESCQCEESLTNEGGLRKESEDCAMQSIVSKVLSCLAREIAQASSNVDVEREAPRLNL